MYNFMMSPCESSRKLGFSYVTLSVKSALVHLRPSHRDPIPSLEHLLHLLRSDADPTRGPTSAYRVDSAGARRFRFPHGLKGTDYKNALFYPGFPLMNVE